MIPEDYKRLSPEVIAKIKPLTDDPETSDTGQMCIRDRLWIQENICYRGKGYSLSILNRSIQLDVHLSQKVL